MQIKNTTLFKKAYKQLLKCFKPQDYKTLITKKKLLNFLYTININKNILILTKVLKLFKINNNLTFKFGKILNKTLQ